MTIDFSKIETHYLHNTDPEWEGMAALCDFTAGLDEEPRKTTLSSALESEVTCPDCLKILAIDRLEEDLRTDKNEKAKKCAKRLLKLGYRMPDCPERWQLERLVGALLGVSMIGESGRDMAERLINTVKLEVP